MKTFRSKYFPLTLAALASLLASTGPASAALPLLPEQIVVTHFSGTISYYSWPPFAKPNLGNNGFVVTKFDTQTGNIGPLIPPNDFAAESVGSQRRAALQRIS